MRAASKPRSDLSLADVREPDEDRDAAYERFVADLKLIRRYAS